MTYHKLRKKRVEIFVGKRIVVEHDLFVKRDRKVYLSQGRKEVGNGIKIVFQGKR